MSDESAGYAYEGTEKLLEWVSETLAEAVKNLDHGQSGGVTVAYARDPGDSEAYAVVTDETMGDVHIASVHDGIGDGPPLSMVLSSPAGRRAVSRAIARMDKLAADEGKLCRDVCDAAERDIFGDVPACEKPRLHDGDHSDGRVVWRLGTPRWSPDTPKGAAP